MGPQYIYTPTPKRKIQMNNPENTHINPANTHITPSANTPMNPSQKITESPSPYRHLEKMSTDELINHINDEDGTVAASIRLVLPRIAASGTTPYVAGALQKCRENNILTGCIVCNPHSPVASHADYPIEVIAGPEFVTGSTRMKCGTATKMILNMISTAVLIRLGRVEDNRMVFMQISNDKLVDRGVKMLMEARGLHDYEEAKSLLLRHGNVHDAINNS